jgi:hypothetical protein
MRAILRVRGLLYLLYDSTSTTLDFFQSFLLNLVPFLAREFDVIAAIGSFLKQSLSVGNLRIIVDEAPDGFLGQVTNSTKLAFANLFRNQLFDLRTYFNRDCHSGSVRILPRRDDLKAWRFA